MIRAGNIIRTSTPMLGWMLQLLDLLIATGLLYLAIVVKFSPNAPPDFYHFLALFNAIFMMLVYRLQGVYYNPRLQNLWGEARILARSWISVILMLAVMSFITKYGILFSREALGYWIALTYGAQMGLRIVAAGVLNLNRRRGYFQQRSLAVGTERSVAALAERLERNPALGIQLLGRICLEHEKNAHPSQQAHLPKVLGTIPQMCNILRRLDVDTVYISLPLSETGRIETLMPLLIMERVNIHWVPEISTLHLLNHGVREIEGQPVLCLTETPISGLSHWIKWGLDKVIAASVLFLASPLILLIALAIKLNSPGPVLFKQIRGGLKGNPILVYKFRTMRVHQETTGHITQAHPGDGRVTTIGNFLRATSLDELPQLVNVLQGRMSLVGPRPHALEHDGNYERQISAYMLRHHIKPGLTGWAQVHGLRGPTEHAWKMEERVKYDLYYINNWSLGLDFMILLMTFWALLYPKNAL